MLVGESLCFCRLIVCMLVFCDVGDFVEVVDVVVVMLDDVCFVMVFDYESLCCWIDLEDWFVVFVMYVVFGWSQDLEWLGGWCGFLWVCCFDV